VESVLSLIVIGSNCCSHTLTLIAWLGAVAAATDRHSDIAIRIIRTAGPATEKHVPVILLEAEMSEAAQPAEGTSAAYGNYILRTGKGVVGELELLYGRHLYRQRFAGKKPVLDLGPGRCWFTKQNVEDIVAVDNSPELVQHYSREGIKIRLGDAYNIPFPDGYFEGVFCCWLFEHLADPARSLAEIHRVMKPGGYACVIVPTPYDMVAFYDDHTHIRPFTKVSLAQLAEDSGMAKHRVEFLRWARGTKLILRSMGAATAAAYFRLCDGALRRLGPVNKRNLMLEAWK
jgi:SAM-dependent methyltransferase